MRFVWFSLIYLVLFGLLCLFAARHRVNTELDLHSLFGPPNPPTFGLMYEGAVGQPR
jgi:hypothetical protein